MNRKDKFNAIKKIVCLIAVILFFSTITLSTYDDSLTYLLQDESVALTVPQDEEPVIEVVQGRVVCIDAGHQGRADMSKEPVGPGAKKKKAKVDGGAMGKKTGLTEYQLNLDIALKLQTELEARGYTVIMTRTSNDVNLSNSQRAAIANEAKADAFIRIHADGSDSKSVNGATALCQTSENPYANNYDKSRLLADSVINSVSTTAGCKNRGVIETDDMTGINWCTVPNIVIEVGYLSNPTEESKLNTDDYQNLIAKGIANGIDEYFGAVK
ncbi:N-acetylmuramoyl-L-alanine amidase [Pseudobutyrivibrio sp. YE44]|uniref:N-acetylmuramoyl-L-alanine amidase family protein n=1 Tax=Pseudobutyrivibrio sp. YE44 TaxID=1520802 RepID=UPI0008876746|nr:N-acetylmuramoyl-L-alanine amidase [Pseudobutyrivibrio sp. YE44]SDB41722.1 N-acetylmuramoyl-L-alanine amidase [Pseudobutyrivibrio sp. YE44]